MKNRFFMAAVLLSAVSLWSCFDDNDDCATVPQAITVATAADFQSALDQGVPNITLSEAPTSPLVLVIPKTFATGTNLVMTVPAGGQTVTVNQDASGGMLFPELTTLNLTNAGATTFNLPNQNMVLNGEPASLTSNTATLIIPKGKTIPSVTLSGGGVTKIYGTATAISNTGGTKALIALGSSSDRPAATDIIKTYAALTNVANGVILTPGNYDNARNGVFTQSVLPTGYTVDFNDPVFAWYLPIEKAGFEIIGEGDRDQIVVYSSEVVPNSDISTQNLITVVAANVKISGVTLMSKEVSNKIIETFASGLTLDNCVFVPNTKVAAGSQSGNGGDVTFSPDATGGTVSNCLFKAANIKFNSLMSGTFTVNKNTFDGVYDSPTYGPYSSIATRNYNSVDVSGSTLTVNGDGNVFKNIAAYNPSGTPPVGYAMIDVQQYGKFVLTNTGLPAPTGTFYNVTGEGELILNGDTHTAP